ncbi:MAG TPA: TetR/AcrR family transcriptional regulator [Solirubrobacteraceae bacterium]|nr:TetR/AcrR family transcriptional regulator [Solirubrobacteraceae bacterium]
MSIPPVDTEPLWALLDPASKRTRLLKAAGEVFARDGLDTPMPVVAAAAGAGIGSVYRQFPSKHELIAELVVDRLDQIAAGAREAGERTGDRWPALTEILWRLLEHQSCDDFFGEAMQTVSGHPAVIAALDRAHGALDQLLVDTRAEGRLRSDATTLDLRLLFAATRAARRVEPDAWRRMLELMIDALDTRRAAPAQSGPGAR